MPFVSCGLSGMTRIMPYVFLGDLLDSNDVPLLVRAGIKSVLRLHNDVIDEDAYLFRPEGVADAYKAAGIRELKFAIDDYSDYGEQMYRLLPEAVAFMRASVERREAVFVHCNVGYSRSPTVVAAYLLQYTPNVAHHSPRVCVEMVIAAIQRVRVINPNGGFRAALHKFAMQASVTDTPPVA